MWQAQFWALGNKKRTKSPALKDVVEKERQQVIHIINKKVHWKVQ